MKSQYITLKQIKLFSLFFIFSTPLFSQENVSIEYDAAGNRIIVHKLTPRVKQDQPLIYGYANTSKGGEGVGNTLSNIGKGISSVVQGAIINTENIIDFTTTSFESLDHSTSYNSNGPFLISPNPSRDIITISEQNKSDLTYTIFLYDSYGNLVEQYIDIQTPLVINLVNCKAGLYYMKILGNNVQQTIKIIKI